MLMAYISVAIAKIDNFFRLVFSMSKNFHFLYPATKSAIYVADCHI